ncbi:S-ribosylhomocysteine lyase [Candidatus Providencia siddallii]|uniref:S-ribosylhomocysteine lyase n=1 Tax=Candidatus Providencia siddallii TaxID=1715285 RepID=A0ABM9NPV0_9GAMM
MTTLNSFIINHSSMKAPAVRIDKTLKTPNNDIITIYDLRFVKPNKEIMPEAGVHTIEHLFANYMRNYINDNNIKIIDISPMGCRTGFYMSLIGYLKEKKIISAWKKSMENILLIQKQKKIPELNIYQCGSYKMHSLKEAKQIAYDILKKGIQINKNIDLIINL